MLKTDFLERPLQLSGLLIFAGLCVELLCLYLTRPIAFVIFLASGGLFLVLGIPLCLVSQASARHPRQIQGAPDKTR
jgi:hypothetical protein